MSARDQPNLDPILEQWSSPAERERLLRDVNDANELRFHREGDAVAALNRTADIRRTLESESDASSTEYARLLNFEARMALAAGNRSAVDRAQPQIHVARSALEAQGLDSKTAVSTYIDTVLNEAVSLKAMGAPDDALDLLREAQRDATLRRTASDLAMMPLYRQEVMMVGTVLAHRNLAKKASELRYLDALDYFASVKRVFEFSLNHGDTHSAKRLFAVLAFAYGSVRGRLTPLAQVSFLKNGGHIAAAMSEGERAKQRLLVADRHARQRGLQGQVRQIALMLEAVKSGEVPQLTTFRLLDVPQRPTLRQKAEGQLAVSRSSSQPAQS